MDSQAACRAFCLAHNASCLPFGLNSECNLASAALTSHDNSVRLIHSWSQDLLVLLGSQGHISMHKKLQRCCTATNVACSPRKNVLLHNSGVTYVRCFPAESNYADRGRSPGYKQTTGNAMLATSCTQDRLYADLPLRSFGKHCDLSAS